jgi:hypothetical protein
MPLKYIRVLTKATEDNPGVAPLIFDVVLDTETSRSRSTMRSSAGSTR